MAPSTTGKQPPAGEYRVVDVHLMCAEELKWPAGPLRRPLQAYAVGWIDPAYKARTLADRAGGENPAWNERFLFKVPSAALAADSTAALTVEIFAASPGGSWHHFAAAITGDHPVGYARILLGPLRLQTGPTGSPHVASLAVRSATSGSIHGSVNLAVTVIPQSKLPTLAVDALRRCPAICFHDLIVAPRALKPSNRQLTASTPPLPPPSPAEVAVRKPTASTPPLPPLSPAEGAVRKPSNRKPSASSPPLSQPSPAKVVVRKAIHMKAAEEENKESEDEDEDEDEEEGDENVSGGGILFCGPCITPFPRKIHASPSDQNFLRFIR